MSLNGLNNRRGPLRVTGPRLFSQLALAAAGLIMGGLLAACTSSGPKNGTSVPTIEPSATVAGARGDPNLTPIPTPVRQSALPAIRQSGIVRVGILYNDPPFSYLAANGDIHGFDVDLINKIADKWGVKAQFVLVTRQTRLPELNSGKVDIIAGSMPHRRELSEFAEFSDSTFLSGVGVLVSNGGSINAITDLNGKTVGTIGSAAQTTLNGYTSASGLTVATQLEPDVSSAADAFGAKGGPQALVGRIEDLMKAATILTNVKILDTPLETEPYALAVRRGDTPLRDMINLTLADLVKSGVYAQVYSADLYGNAASTVNPLSGDPAYTFQNFPSDIASSGSILGRIKQGQGLKIGGFGGGGQPAPYDGQAIVDGYNKAIINELGRRWNVPVQAVPDTTGQAGLDALKSGQIDLLVGVRPTLPLLGNVALSEGYYQRGLRLINLSGVTLQGIDDLQFKNVVITDPLDVSQDLVVKNSQYAHISQATSNDDAFKSLTEGSTYALVGDEFTMMLMSQADTRIRVFPRRYRPSDYVMAMRPGDADFMNLVNFTLQNMKVDGTLDKLVTQYFGPYTPADDPFDPVPIEIWPGDGSYLGVGVK